MEIKSTSEATRLMTVAFKLSMHMLGKSDLRREQIYNTAKKLISAAENYINKQAAQYIIATK
jgi:hypothetical protein